LLVWDAFRGHITTSVKKQVKTVYNTDMCVIPGKGAPPGYSPLMFLGTGLLKRNWQSCMVTGYFVAQ